jgi:arylformamidase
MKIHDLTLPISPSLIVWPDDPPIEMTHSMHLDRGDICTVTRMNLSVHTGTHLDAPAHFIPGGTGVETLDLNTLMGPALLVEALEATAVTADLLNALPIPAGSERLLIKTSNSRRWASGETNFYEDYVAVSADGAQWLVDNGLKLVGVDYLSVAPFKAVVECHQILLGAGIIPVEGLNLHGIKPGLYQFICLPLLIEGSDGAPCRAVLID